MVNKPQHNIPSKEKLLAFVRGELSAKERLDIAKAMEENPFLADVVEGLRLSENREKNIVELEQKIRVKYQNKGGAKVISFQSKAILTAAASVLLLLSFGIYQKMLKLDETRVVSEQTFKNEQAPQTILKANEGAENSENLIEEESEEKIQTVTLNTAIAEQQKQSESKNLGEKSVSNKQATDKLESLVDETKAPQPITATTGAVMSDGDKDYNSKKDISGKAYVSDNVMQNAAPAYTSGRQTTHDIPKREEGQKKKNSVYRAEEQPAAASQEEIIQEKESSKKSLTREVADQNIPFNQAIALHNRKNFEAAFSIMDSLAQKNPKNIEYQYYAGTFAYDNKLYHKAISYLEPISKDNKNNYQEASKWFLALSYKAIGKNEKAKSLLKDIASKNNNYQQMAADTLKTME